MSRKVSGGSPPYSPVMRVDALGEGQLWGGPLNHGNQGDFKTLHTEQRDTPHVQRPMAFALYSLFFKTDLIA